MKHSYRRKRLAVAMAMMAGSVLFWFACGGGSPAASDPTAVMTVGGSAALPAAAAASIGSKAYGLSDLTMKVMSGESELASCAIGSDGSFTCDVMDEALVPAAGTILRLSAEDAAGSAVLEARCAVSADATTLDCGTVDAATTLALWGIERVDALASVAVTPSLSAADLEELYGALSTVFSLEMTDLSNVNAEMFALDFLAIYQAYVSAVEAGVIDSSAIIADDDFDILVAFLAENFATITEGVDDVDALMIAIISLEPLLLSGDGKDFFLQIIASAKASDGSISNAILGIGGLSDLTTGMGLYDLDALIALLTSEQYSAVVPLLISSLTLCDDSCALTADSTFDDFEQCVRGLRVLGLIGLMQIMEEGEDYNPTDAAEMAVLADAEMSCTIQNCGGLDFEAIMQQSGGELFGSEEELTAAFPAACVACVTGCLGSYPDRGGDCVEIFMLGIFEVTDWAFADDLELGGDDDDDELLDIDGTWTALVDGWNLIEEVAVCDGDDPRLTLGADSLVLSLAGNEITMKTNTDDSIFADMPDQCFSTESGDMSSCEVKELTGWDVFDIRGGGGGCEWRFIEEEDSVTLRFSCELGTDGKDCQKDFRKL